MVFRTGNSSSSSSSSSGAAALYQTVMQQPVEPDDAQAACMLDLMLPDTIISILQLLAGCPQHIVSFSLASSQAYQLCSDANLWTDLCRSITDTLPAQLRSVDWSPSAWQLGSHKELYICLLHPYAPLLRQRVWHTTKMPAGQLLVVDAQPPLIVGRSVHVRTLQGPLYSHPVFLIRLPADAKGKAGVHCCGCHQIHKGDSLSAMLGLMLPDPDAQDSDGIDSSSNPDDIIQQAAAGAPTAHVTFLQPAAAAPAAAASGPAQQHRQPQAGHYCAVRSSESAGADSADSRACARAAGFSLHCEPACGRLYAEQMARWSLGRLYNSSPAAAAAAGSSATGSSSSQQPAPPPPAAAAGSSSSSGGSGSDAGPASLPLPEVDDYRMSHWDVRYDLEDLCMNANHTSQATYRPFCIQPWIRLPSAAAAAAAEAAAEAEAEAGVPAAAAAAAGLTGLWRGTYGAHGVELVQLQLLAAPLRYDLLQHHPVQQPPPEDVEDCLPGVLLQSLLHVPRVEANPWVMVYDTDMPGEAPVDSVVPEAGGPAQQLGEAGGQGALMAEPAAAAGQDAVGGQAAGEVADAGGNADATAHSNHHRHQQQQQRSTAQLPQQQQQQQQLLLVATKVTGDRNVPAGQVSFAVDLGSRSTVGAGQPLQLQLPHGTNRAVELNAPGTRPLLVKERYTGLAQIAATYFESPKINAVELVVFDHPQCFGVMWASPMNTFSFFVRDELCACL